MSSLSAWTHTKISFQTVEEGQIFSQNVSQNRTTNYKIYAMNIQNKFKLKEQRNKVVTQIKTKKAAILILDKADFSCTGDKKETTNDNNNKQIMLKHNSP